MVGVAENIFVWTTTVRGPNGGKDQQHASFATESGDPNFATLFVHTRRQKKLKRGDRFPLKGVGFLELDTATPWRYLAVDITHSSG